MDIHKNARLSFRSREELAGFVLKQGATRKAAAAAFRVSVKTVAKWVVRFQLAGVDGLGDRSSRPHRSPRQTHSFLVEKVLVLRRGHMPGYEIARRTGTRLGGQFLALVVGHLLAVARLAVPVRRRQRQRARQRDTG